MKNHMKPAWRIVWIGILVLIITAVCFLTDPVMEDKAVPDGTLKDPHELAWLYWAQYMQLEHSATLRYMSLGQARSVQVSYDGKNYTFSDEAGERQYQYCVKSQATTDIDRVEEYFFLTDDPDMTADRYLAGENDLATELLYVDRKTFDGARNYGEIPESIDEILQLEQSTPVWWYCRNSMFGIRYILALSSVREACIVERFDYSGNLLCEFESRGVPQTMLELEDGGFVVFGTSEPDGLYAFTCCDAGGNLRWRYTPEEGGRKYVPYMYQENGDIYCFGTVTPTSQSSDIFIWRISPDGELVQKTKIGGSDFDDIHRVLKTETGFEILGSTQSKDGDLPFSETGYGVDFRLEISPELQVLSKENFENNYASQIGYHHGQPVFEDSPMLNITGKDRIPEGMGRYVRGIFDWEDGYAIIRTVKHDTYAYANPLLSRLSYYEQIVITGYDAKGNPQWQLAGNVHPD